MTRWPVGKPYPAAMTDAELMDVLGIRKSQFYKLKAAGQYDGWMCRPNVTGTTRYSGKDVQRWAERENRKSA